MASSPTGSGEMNGVEGAVSLHQPSVQDVTHFENGGLSAVDAAAILGQHTTNATNALGSHVTAGTNAVGSAVITSGSQILAKITENEALSQTRETEIWSKLENVQQAQQSNHTELLDKHNELKDGVGNDIDSMHAKLAAMESKIDTLSQAVLTANGLATSFAAKNEQLLQKIEQMEANRAQERAAQAIATNKVIEDAFAKMSGLIQTQLRDGLATASTRSGVGEDTRASLSNLESSFRGATLNGGSSLGQGSGYPGVGSSIGQGSGYPGVGSSIGQGSGYPGVGSSIGQGSGYPGVGSSIGQGSGYPGVGSSISQSSAAGKSAKITGYSHTYTPKGPENAQYEAKERTVHLTDDKQLVSTQDERLYFKSLEEAERVAEKTGIIIKPYPSTGTPETYHAEAGQDLRKVSHYVSEKFLQLHKAGFNGGREVPFDTVRVGGVRDGVTFTRLPGDMLITSTWLKAAVSHENYDYGVHHPDGLAPVTDKVKEIVNGKETGNTFDVKLVKVVGGIDYNTINRAALHSDTLEIIKQAESKFHQKDLVKARNQESRLGVHAA